MLPNPPPPWDRFLGELDGLLDEPYELHCIGGFAAVVAYGLPRSTNDLDYFSLVPLNRAENIQRIAGESSSLADKYKVYIHQAGIATLPENYTERLTELFGGRFNNVRLLVPDPYDLVLSKLGRNSQRDREDVQYLAQSQHLHPGVLRNRYERELRSIMTGSPEWHDQTLQLWLDAYFSNPGG